jgi:hypothetical protein
MGIKGNHYCLVFVSGSGTGGGFFRFIYTFLQATVVLKNDKLNELAKKLLDLWRDFARK